MSIQRALYIAGAVSLAALTPMAAKAADMPQYTPPPVVTAVPTWDWSGFYVGLNAGYGWSASDEATANLFSPTGFFTPCVGAGSCLTSISYSRDGFVGGAQAGYNWQINQFVVGFEADIDYSDMRGDNTVSTNVAPFARFSAHSSSEIEWLATLRARAGLTVDRALIYATGGLAVGRVNDAFNWGYPSLGQVYSGGERDTEWGWTVGGGAEFMVTQNFTLGAEVLYFDLGDTTVVGSPIAPFAPPAGTTMSVTNDHDGVIVRAKANYKF